jgi:4-amino-4-deoxy-L-arabinose transferase-like glycosyltransferase
VTVLAAPPLPVAAGVTGRSWGSRWGWSVATLAVVTLLVTGWGVGGSMSDYYASIALSMSKSWSNFFFGAMDPAGTVTLDKIPGSFWIPALFVRVFGFSPWAVIVPNALAASASVVVVCVTARHWAGPLAGLTAGAVVATTPILVAVARSNQPETFFVLALALTAWAATRALDRRSLGWLLLAGVFIAAGFHTYMLEAWAVWPALALAYLCTPQSRARRIWHLAVAGATSLALSLVWIVAVALVPASARPYIGSTLSNNPWEMVFGYNGLGRFGQVTADETAYRSFTPPFSGSPAALRLLNDALATQIGWMLPTALVAVAVLFVLRFRLPLTVFGTAWFVTFAAMFSAVAGMHQFYTAALAIPTALLIGTAFALARRRGVLWAQLALPATAAVTALCISIATPAATYSLVAAALQCAVAAVTAGLVLTERRRGRRMPVTAAAGVIALLLTPMVWAVVTMGTPNSTNPVAGGVAAQGVPGASGGFGAGRAPGGGPGGGAGTFGQAPSAGRDGRAAGGAGTGGIGRGNGMPVFGASSTAQLAWLEAHRDGTPYLAAAFGAQSAASLIIASDGQPVLPIGGFNGEDPVPTLAAFQQLIADGDLRYVLAGSAGALGSGGGAGGVGSGGDTGSTSAEIRAWVRENCTAMTDAAASGIYDCTP